MKKSDYLRMGFLFAACSLMLLSVSCRPGLPAKPYTISLYTNKPAISYSDYKGQDGQTVHPIWGQVPLTDFGSRSVTFDDSGVRRLNPVPAPGVHPRILCAPDDLPDIRRRLTDTRCGQRAWNYLLCWTEMMKGQYGDSQPYAQPDFWQGSFGGLHGPVPLFRLGVPRQKGAAYNHNPLAAEYWNTLVDGSATNFPSYYWNVFALEAFRCWVKDDADGARKLAKAVLTAMHLDQARRDAERAAKHETGPISQPVGGFQLSFTYDFIYHWLNDGQRQAIHDELANTTWAHDNYGTFNTAVSSRSNWATFSYWLMEVLGVEGEPGFNELKVRGMYRGWRDLFSYGWFQSGAVFEGEAKDQLGMDGVIALAMRQQQYGFQNLCGHPYLRAYADNFLPKSVIPTQDGFIKYDLLGGAHGQPMPMDSLGLKYMFPDDQRIDWLYRCAVGEDYQNIPQRPDGYRDDLLFYLIFAEDYEPSNDNPGKLDISNTFFGGERALLMTRSGWNTNALMLDLHVRQANGGHPFADRNAIMVAGAGRVWSPPGYATFYTAENSCVDIDGKNQDVHSPGRMVAFQDEPEATFAVGDAAYAWDWNERVLRKPRGYYTVTDAKAGRVDIPKGWEPEEHSINDFSFLKLPFAYLDTPLFEQPDWILPNGAISPEVRQANYPVRRAFRTAGLVRGPHPYALVLDDIQKDDAVHEYMWTLTVEPDIQIFKIERRGKNELDVILTGNDPLQTGPRSKTPLPAEYSGMPPAGQPMLLVRALNVNSTETVTPDIIDPPNLTDAKKYGSVRRLIIPAKAVAPDYRVLLYAYREGDVLPETEWNAGHTQVQVKFPGQEDQIAMQPDASGNTSLTIRRAGKVLIQMNQKLPPPLN